MILSSTEENWMRVSIMHSVAKDHFESTRDTDFRKRQIKKGDFFPFDAVAFDVMQQESCLIGMIMAWAVIALESLANHALAETLNNRYVAISAIEYPKNIIKKDSSLSELAAKIILLNDQIPYDKKIIKIANELAAARNLIVHDKPFWFDQESGEIKNFSTRGHPDARKLRFEDLKQFYRKCDLIVDSIAPHLDSEAPSSTFRFSALT